MLKKYKTFSKEHPYWHVLLILSLASVFGITLEYMLNKDFIGSGVYATVFLGIIEIIRVRNRKK